MDFRMNLMDPSACS